MAFRSVLVCLLVFGWVDCIRADDITVSAAISLKESLEAIRPFYESASGDHVKLTFGASGQLAAQIENGAPVDLFVSAARQQIDELQTSGKVSASTSAVIASNEMVLIVPADAKSPPKAFADLGSVQRLAIGEPKTVPAGEYARQTLEHLKLTDKLKGKIIYGLNVRQVLQYVESGEVDAGIVYLSDAQQSRNKVKVIARAEPEWHEPIEYIGAVIDGSAHSQAAKKLLAYLQTEPAQRILHARGFTNPTTHPTTAPAK
jgi:molybdate transport system substrate-binding protein